MKTLSILIPTYNRAEILPNAVNSIMTQIESFGLQESVTILICNDCSPDDTKDYLQTLDKSYISVINRHQNLGMSANIFSALTELCRTEWVLILTDDDTLESNILPKILEKCQELSQSNIAICLTPRYSYLSNGELHCIACESFEHDTLVEAGPAAAGQLMGDGFVLSGILLKPDKIDYSLWRSNIENAMFPVIFTGTTLCTQRGYFWSKKIVNHTVLNECFWDRWGKTEADRECRLFRNWLESYSILWASYVDNPVDQKRFLVSATKTIRSLYDHYLFTFKAGMGAWIKLYGIRKTLIIIADTVFCYSCFKAILVTFCTRLKIFLKTSIKSLLLLRRPDLSHIEALLASVMLLFMVVARPLMPKS